MGSDQLSSRTWLSQVDTVLTKSGLVRSPAPFSVAATPNTLVDRSYCFELPQSADTDKYRGGGDEEIRVRHSLTIRLAKVVKPGEQFQSQLAGLDTEDALVKVMLTRNNFGDMRVLWLGTARDLTPAREHIISDLSFDCEHDWSFGNP